MIRYQSEGYFDDQIRLTNLEDFEYHEPMTSYERYRLRTWVYSGHDIDANPWGYVDSDGYQLNNLDSLRLSREEYEYKKEMNDYN